MPEEFHLEKVSGIGEHNLIAVRTGGAWVYVDSWETYFKKTSQHSKRFSRLLEANPISSASYATHLARGDRVLAGSNLRYLRYVGNLCCAHGLAEKLLGRTVSGTPYTLLLAKSRAPEVKEALIKMWDLLDSRPNLSFAEASENLFGGVKGSFFWAKGLAEHLVYLGLARHADKWRITT